MRGDAVHATHSPTGRLGRQDVQLPQLPGPPEWVDHIGYHHNGRDHRNNSIGCKLSTNRKRKPMWRRCVAASIAVGPSAILTGSRTRPSDWGWNRRFGPVEDRRNNHRLVTVTCIIWILQIWWPSPSPTLRGPDEGGDCRGEGFGRHSHCVWRPLPRRHPGFSRKHLPDATG